MRPIGHDHTDTTNPPSSERTLVLTRSALVLVFLLGLSLLVASFEFNHADSHMHIQQLVLVGASALAIGAFLTLLFVTLRLQKSEARAAKAERYLKVAIENVSEGFVIFDKHERLVMFNERYRDMYPSIAHKLIPGLSLVIWPRP